MHENSNLERDMRHNNNNNNVKGNRNNQNKGKEMQENFRNEIYKNQLNAILNGSGSKSGIKIIDNEMQHLNNMMSNSYIEKQAKKNKFRKNLSNMQRKTKPTTLKIKEKQHYLLNNIVANKLDDSIIFQKRHIKDEWVHCRSDATW